MVSKIWRSINSPIVILALVIAAFYFGLFDPMRSVSRITGNSSSSSMSFISYFDGKKYESKILKPDDVKGPSLNLEEQDLPISPKKAISLARETVTPSIPNLVDLKVRSVELGALDGDGHYSYVVEFDRNNDPYNGLRIVVLMDGTVIKPISE